MSFKIFLIISFLLFFFYHDSYAYLPKRDIGEWAKSFGELINKVASKSISLFDIQMGYLYSSPVVKPLNGSDLLFKVKSSLEDIFFSRVEAIQNLTSVIEKSFASHTYITDMEFSYPKSKYLYDDFQLIRDPFFPNFLVNLTKSTVHVPTNVYDESDPVLNGVAWSQELDETFNQNRVKSPSLSWQYFCSSIGFLRSYPGTPWPRKGVDLFDCRIRRWYIKAAASSKDALILLDTSGSMRGLRMEIARATVKNIIETFSDDDFFNVILFSDNPKYLLSCFNGSLVQATVKNKKMVTDKLGEGIRTHNIAYFDRALNQAFQLFEKTKNYRQGCMCNRIIMIITDGASEKYEQIFNRYNSPSNNSLGEDRRIRVFTYLIGREASDPTNIKWMACNNKGYFSHISTLADISEHVQDYIRVLSRPLVIGRYRNMIWTNIYGDINTQQLTTTVAVPVYDTRNDSYNDGNLLGVMGTDVLLSVLTNTLPKHQLGAHSYAFAITNNGFVIFHPDHRPYYEGKLKENYNSLDISEVEFVDDGIEVPNHRQLLLPFRQEMIRQKTGKVRLRVKVAEDQMRRVSIRDTTYYYIPVEHTPFSLGVAVPDGHSQNYLDGRIRVRKAKLYTLKNSNLTLAPWEYCWPANHSDARLPQYDLILKYLKISQTDKIFLKRYCYQNLVESLLFDAKATSNVVKSWRRDNGPRVKKICIGDDCIQLIR